MKSPYPAYDKARTSFNRHLRKRRDIIKERYEQRFEALKLRYRQRFKEANDALLLDSERRISDKSADQKEFMDANQGIICAENMSDAWDEAQVKVVIGIDSESRQFGTGHIVTENEAMPRYDVPFAIRGDPVKDDDIMFGTDVDEHLRHGLARVVMGHSVQAMRIGEKGPERWRVPDRHLHPKVGYLWTITHHPLEAYEIHLAARLLQASGRRGSPTGLLGLTATEILTPTVFDLIAYRTRDHDELDIVDSAMLTMKDGGDGNGWKRNVPYDFERGKVDRSERSRSFSRMTIETAIPEAATAWARGWPLGEVIELPSCGNAAIDSAVAGVIVRHAENDIHGRLVITLEITSHVPLVQPPDPLIGHVAALAASS